MGKILRALDRFGELVFPPQKMSEHGYLVSAHDTPAEPGDYRQPTLSPEEAERVLNRLDKLSEGDMNADEVGKALGRLTEGDMKVTRRQLGGEDDVSGDDEDDERELGYHRLVGRAAHLLLSADREAGGDLVYRVGMRLLGRWLEQVANEMTPFSSGEDGEEEQVFKPGSWGAAIEVAEWVLDPENEG